MRSYPGVASDSRKLCTIKSKLQLHPGEVMTKLNNTSEHLS